MESMPLEGAVHVPSTRPVLVEEGLGAGRFLQLPSPERQWASPRCFVERLLLNVAPSVLTRYRTYVAFLAEQHVSNEPSHCAKETDVGSIGRAPPPRSRTAGAAPVAHSL